MTSDEIKAQLSMRDVVQQYGISVNRSGMCCCPIHGEKHPSMKIYKDSFNCFACGANGDIFTFVQLVDNCDFKTAFYTLGGSYKEQTDKAKTAAKLSRQLASNKKGRVEQAQNEFKQALIDALNLAKYSIDHDAPLSDTWCLSQNFLPVAQMWWESKFENGEEVNEIDVFRKCSEFRQELNRIRQGTDGANEY